MLPHRPRSKSRSRSLASLVIATAALGVAAAGCQEIGTIDPGQAEVVQFQSCGAVESFVKEEAIGKLDLMEQATSRGEVYSPFGYTNLAQAGLDEASATNNQEAGVDEADLLQVDGSHAFALHDDRLVIVEAYSDASGGILQIDGAEVVADITLQGEPIEMFLAEDTVVVMVDTDQGHVGRLYENISSKPQRSIGSRLVEAHVYDVTNRRNPVLERRVAVEGEYVAARRVDDRVFLVSRAGLGVAGPQLLVDPNSMDNAAWREAQMAAVEQANLDAWLPYAYSTSYVGTATGQAEASVQRAGCGSVYTARTASGDDALGIYSFDMHDPSSEVDVTTFIGDGTIVYASLEGLLVAHTNYAEAKHKDGDTEDVEATTIHRFAFEKDGGTEYWASGIVHGWIMNQFGLSEHDGYIRVATQMNRATTGFKPINLFTMPIERVRLDADPSLQSGISVANAAPRAPEKEGEASPQTFMQVRGELVDIAHGEDLFAVRFMGDKAFMITWEEVKGDPLFTIDLSNQADPEIRGELWVPGFSTYLHPIHGGQQLVGVGTNTTDGSVKLSLFDVSNFDKPAAVEEIAVGGAGSDSEAEEEHRAFRWIADRNLVALPVTGNRNTLEIFQVQPTGFQNVASVDHAGAELRRSYTIGDHLYALSEAGLSIVNLDDFGTRARVEF